MNKAEIQKYVVNDWFQAMLEEIQADIIETRFSIEEQIISAKHRVGKTICQNEDKASIAELVLVVARELKVSTRTIEQSVQFYKFDPELSVLKEGKNISWRKCLLRMQKPKVIEPCVHKNIQTIIICADCGDKVEHVD